MSESDWQLGGGTKPTVLLQRCDNKETWSIRKIGEAIQKLEDGHNDRHACTSCHKSFASSQTLKLHQKSHTIQGKAANTCHLCHKIFSNPSNLKTHMLSHAKSEVCEFCKKIFARKGRLNPHMRIHLGETPYACTKCGKSYNSGGTLRRHVAMHRKEGIIPKPKDRACTYCEKRFSSVHFLANHGRVHTGEMSFTCNSCPKSYKTEGGLHCHSFTHMEKSSKCEFCGKLFSGPYKLRAHIKIHTGEKTHVCDVCSKRLLIKKDLNVHYRTHTGEKPFKCNICTKGFSHSGSLNIHSRTHI